MSNHDQVICPLWIFAVFLILGWAVKCFYPWPIRAVGYCAMRRLSPWISVRPAFVTTLQSTIFNGTCSYLVQPLTFVGTWSKLVVGFLCSYSRIQWHFEVLLMHWLTRFFAGILIKIQKFSFTKMHLKISSVNCRTFCPGWEWVKRPGVSTGWWCYQLPPHRRLAKPRRFPWKAVLVMLKEHMVSFEKKNVFLEETFPS